MLASAATTAQSPASSASSASAAATRSLLPPHAPPLDSPISCKCAHLDEMLIIGQQHTQANTSLIVNDQRVSPERPLPSASAAEQPEGVIGARSYGPPSSASPASSSSSAATAAAFQLATVTLPPPVVPATATRLVKSGDKISSCHSSESSQSLSASVSTEGGGGEADGAPDAATTVPAGGGGQQRRVSAGGAGWMKLRSTVHMASAIQRQRRRKKEASRLSRQDSFLVKFSTRHSGTSSISSLASLTSLSGAGGDGVSRMTSMNDSRTSDTGAREDGDAAAAAAGGHVTDADDDDVDEDDMLCPPYARYVNADGTFMFYWLASVTAALLYNVWTTIARQGFPELQRDYSALWYTLDAVSDVIFVCDMAVQFRTGYLENGLVVYESSKLARYYRRSRAFYLDVACLTPLDLIQIWTGINPLLRFPRFLKVHRALKFAYMVETRTAFPNVWRVANLSHILFLGSHWFAVFYYMISQSQGFADDWGYPRPEGEFASVTRKYLRSLHWSMLTLTTIGDLPPPVTDWEYVFTIVSYLIGVFVFATIVGQVGNVITNRNASRQEFERQLDAAKVYMRTHAVPREMQRRVQRWYDYAWLRGKTNGTGDVNSLEMLPDKLKTELAIHVNLEILKKATIFQECTPEFLHDLVLKMRAFVFTPGDMICRKGEVAREMFIIADGLLEVTSDTGEVLTSMTTGDFFGEIGLLNLDGGVNRRTADVRSVGYSELFVLSRDDVLCALRDHPEAERLITEFGRKRLQQLQNQRKPQGSEPSSPLHGILSSTASLMHGLTMVAQPSTCAASPATATHRTWASEMSRAAAAEAAARSPSRNSSFSHRHRRSASTSGTPGAPGVNVNNNHQPAKLPPDKGSRSAASRRSWGGNTRGRGHSIVDFSRRLMRRLAGDKRRDSGSTRRSAESAASITKMRDADGEASRNKMAADERNRLLISADEDSDLRDAMMLSPNQIMTAIAETEESEIDDLFSPVTAYSNLVSPSNVQPLLSNSPSTNASVDLASNALQTTPAGSANTFQNNSFTDTAVMGRVSNKSEENEVKVILKKMLLSRPASLLRPRSCSDAATQVMPGEIGTGSHGSVEPPAGFPVDFSRRNSFDPRLIHNVSPRNSMTESVRTPTSTSRLQANSGGHATTMLAAERSLSIPYVDDDVVSNRSLGNRSRSNLSLSPRSLSGHALASQSPGVSMTTPQATDDIVNRLFQSIANLLRESMTEYEQCIQQSSRDRPTSADVMQTQSRDFSGQ